MTGATDLHIDYDQIDAAVTTTTGIHAELDQTNQQYDSLVSSVGHSGLADVISNFAGSWAIHRRHLLTEVETLNGNLRRMRDDFRATDQQLAPESGGQGGSQAVPASTPAPATPAPGSANPSLPSPPPAAAVDPNSPPSEPTGTTPGPGGADLPGPDAPRDDSYPVLPDPRPAEEPTEGDTPQEVLADIHEDSEQFSTLLGSWAREAVRLDSLGMPLSLLGAGTLSLLAMYGKLPPGYSMRPDGSVVKAGASAGSSAAGSTAADLLAPSGTDKPAATADAPLSPDEVRDLLTPLEPSEGDVVAVDSDAVDSVDELPESVDDSGTIPDGAPSAPEPRPMEDVADAPGTGTGSTAGSGMPLPPPPADASSPVATGGGAGGGSAPTSAPSGTPLLASPTEVAAQLLAPSAGSSPPVGVAATAGSAAAATAALAAMATPAAPAAAAVPAPRPDVAPHVAAMGSLSAMSAPMSSGASAGSLSVPGGGPVAGVRGDAAERVRAVREALDRLGDERETEDAKETTRD